MSCKNSLGNCSNCQGCNNKIKPIDCPGNGCGRCCGPNKAIEREFIDEFLEMYYLPCLFVNFDNQIQCIYKDNINTPYSKIKVINDIILKLEHYKYISLDYQIELDEYSYDDFVNFNMNDYLKTDEKLDVFRGSLAITDKFIEKFKYKS